jgi:hypothetical protein
MGSGATQQESETTCILKQHVSSNWTMIHWLFIIFKVLVHNITTSWSYFFHLVKISLHNSMYGKICCFFGAFKIRSYRLNLLMYFSTFRNEHFSYMTFLTSFMRYLWRSPPSIVVMILILCMFYWISFSKLFKTWSTGLKFFRESNYGNLHSIVVSSMKSQILMQTNHSYSIFLWDLWTILPQQFVSCSISYNSDLNSIMMLWYLLPLFLNICLMKFNWSWTLPYCSF